MPIGVSTSIWQAPLLGNTTSAPAQTNPDLVAIGDSNTDAAIFTNKWWNQLPTRALDEYSAPGARLTLDANNILSQITGVGTSDPTAIYVAGTCYTNDIRTYIDDGDKTPAQILALLQEHTLDCMREAHSEGVFPIFATQHYLYQAATEVGGYGWDSTEIADSETVITNLNAWLADTASDYTFAVADVNGAIDDTGQPAGQRGMLDEWYASLPHWNEAAHEGPVMQAFLTALNNAPSVFTPGEYDFDESYFLIDDWIPDPDIATTIELTLTPSSVSGTRTPIQSNNAVSPDLYFQCWNNVNGSFGLWGQFNVTDAFTMVVSTEYDVEIIWPATSGDGTINISGLITDTTNTRGSDDDDENLNIGAGVAGANDWLGNIKHVRIYEGGYLVGDIPIDEGTGTTINNLITGGTYTLTEGSGSW
jgi:hypothetical protein